MITRGWAVLGLFVLSGCASDRLRDGPALVDVSDRVPDLRLDIRYFGDNNFVGTRIDGYGAPKCLLLETVAEALAQVEADLRKQGLRLQIFDCYRPKRAVAHFMRWAKDLSDQRGKSRWYPNLDKSTLVPDYIAEQSGHSRADTLDVTLIQCADVDRVETCQALDMGTEFDFFDLRANTDSDLVDPEQKQNRQILRAAMAEHGFVNYPLEWWHFTLPDPQRPQQYLDVPITVP